MKPSTRILSIALWAVLLPLPAATDSSFEWHAFNAGTALRDSGVPFEPCGDRVSFLMEVFRANEDSLKLSAVAGLPDLSIQEWWLYFSDLPDAIPAILPLPLYPLPGLPLRPRNLPLTHREWDQKIWPLDSNWRLVLWPQFLPKTAVCGIVPRQVGDFATDGEGRIWAMVSTSGSSDSRVSDRSFNAIASFSPLTASWQGQPCPEAPAHGHLQGLVALFNGSIVSLWQDGGRSVLMLYREDKWRRWSTVEAAFTDPRLLPLSRGGLAITERGPQVAIIPPDGNPMLSPIPEEMMTRPNQATDSRSYASVHAVESPEHHLWLWSYALQKLDWESHIDGFIRRSSRGFDRITGLPITAGSPISAVVSDGKETMYVAEADANLVSIHFPDLKPTEIRSLEPAFTHIEKMAFVDGALLVVTCPEPDTVHYSSSTIMKGILTKTSHHYPVGRRTGGLWRIKDGQFDELITGLDDKPGFGWVDRPLIATAKGWLLGTTDGGPWWVPKGDLSAFSFDERQGFSLPSTVAIATVGNDRFIARSTGGQWEVSPLPGPERHDLPTRTALFHYSGVNILQARNLHLWAVEGRCGGLITEWDGQTWHPSSMLNLGKDFDTLEFAGDSQEHGWLIPRDCGKTPVLDFATGHWRIFDSLEQAVGELLAPGESLVMHRDWVFAPVSHRNGTQAFFDWQGMVHIRQHDHWTRTSIHDIAGADARITGAPYFDADGLPHLPLSTSHYQFRADGKWVKTSAEDRPEERTYLRDYETPPQHGPVPHAISISHDRHGISWLATDAGELWKSLDGATVQILNEGRPRLLPPHTYLAEILTDANQNAFLQHSFQADTVTYTKVAPLPPPVVKPAAITSLKDGALVVQLSSIPALWQRWRIDKKAWHPPVHQTELKLEHLPVGGHVLDIEVFDAELTPVGEIQSLSFTVEAASKRVFATLLRQLQSDDLAAREAAARSLTAQGTAALPKLNQAVKAPNASPSLQWWLHAIIQHIETPDSTGGQR